MRGNRSIALVTLVFLFALGISTAADAADVHVLCSVGLKAVMDDLAPKFERASGNKVVVTYGLASGLKQQIEAGTPNSGSEPVRTNT